ncbi:chalcone isomerase family protein [Photobacterium nomapromontoriensis]|uniref:chalcone isomerase family protein n=1 Tax=Photobacterium nomapromontoriensis TaxID=2910237 RepID=UPI003D126643
MIYNYTGKYVMLCLFMVSIICVSSMVSASIPWQSWPTVGSATLTWGPWVIYDSELRTPDGDYTVGQREVALVIKYRRNIDKEELLEATDEQWQHLNVSSLKRQRWLHVLATIWPDVKDGDRLIFVLNQKRGRFYQDNKVIGAIPENEMSQYFLNIWLSPNTAYPRMRQQLMGN